MRLFRNASIPVFVHPIVSDCKTTTQKAKYKATTISRDLLTRNSVLKIEASLFERPQSEKILEEAYEYKASQ